ncbi:MAG: YdcF family protein [Chitinispirillia bacterium]|nr:YdcF family protein [Chitinispirillia bacterium]MCL2242665.1 YdcF family protein [Chitinispirillia bacterium]
MLAVSKIIGALIDPAALALFLLAAGAVFLFFPRRPRVSAVFFICAFAVLAFFSMPFISHVLLRGLEGQYLPASEYEPADAVVLLGGFTAGPLPPRLHVETNISANRAFNAVRVFRQTGTRPMVLTGGLVDLINDEVIPEAHSMFALLSEHFGIDSSDVIIEPGSRNTRENALYTKAALAEAEVGHNIILVTSAYHMPRAAAVFRKAGFTVTPAPAGYIKTELVSGKPLTWFPSATSLFESALAVREYCGIASYKIMGWI